MPENKEETVNVGNGKKVVAKVTSRAIVIKL
jgi:hypothetical protein